MEKLDLLYEGKAKKLYRTNDEQIMWVAYKDSATAFNGEKKSEIPGKGRLNNEITGMMFSLLKKKGIESHYIQLISDYEQLVKRVDIFPLEVVVRNTVAGSMAKRLGLEEGLVLNEPVVEFYYKDDSLGDPLVTEDHIQILGAASEEETGILRQRALEINALLKDIFIGIGVHLIDFKLEFGKDSNGSIILADEISPDTCRLWDTATGEKLDKDVFRRDLGNLTNAYEEILNRLRGATAHV